MRVFTACIALLILSVGLFGQSPGDVLFASAFGNATIGAKPAGWQCMFDEGNTCEIADLNGTKCLHMTKTGGTVWMPLACGSVNGSADVCVQLDFDWYLVGKADANEKAFKAALRLEGNIYFVEVAIGGPKGIAALSPKGWLNLSVPVRQKQWNHIISVPQPLKKKAGMWRRNLPFGRDENQT